MMVMTAKVNFKKILTILAAIAGVIIALILLLRGGNDEAATTAADSISNNDARVQFLADHGWEVNASPTQSGQVRIPEESTEVFDRYNALQQSQGYDLREYAGKTVMRYVYTVNNYPDSTQPVYATLLIHKNQVIGGDITDTAATGIIQGFTKSTPATPAPTLEPQEVTQNTETTETATVPET